MTKKPEFSCPICPDDCHCGLATLASRFSKEIESDLARILTISQAAPTELGGGGKMEVIFSHSVVKEDMMVIEQYFGSDLITTFGPFAQKFAPLFDQILAGLESRAVARYPAKNDKDEG